MFLSSEGTESSDVTEFAIVAAINFIELCLQQTAFMAGRGTIMEDNVKASKLHVEPMYFCMTSCQLAGAKVIETKQPLSDTQSAAAHCLKFLGKRLHLTPLNNTKRF